MKIVGFAWILAILGSAVSLSAAPEVSPEAAAASAQKALAEAIATAAANPVSASEQEQLISGNPALTLPRCGIMACTAVAFLQPVCAFSFCAGVRTFYSPCELANYNRCNPQGYVVLFQGACERFFRCYRRSILAPTYPEGPLLPETM